MPLITTDISKVIAHLQSGKIASIPTETVYGLAALYDNENALKSVFSLKNRPADHPLILHVAQDWDLHQIVQNIPDYAQKFIDTFWPGPLTLVLPLKSGSLHPLVNGGQSSVAIRCPAHPLAQKILKELKKPLVAPSANPFGKVSPTTAAHVADSFADKELLILDGGRCTVGIESTIVDATRPNSFQILRQGLISESKLNALSGTFTRHTQNSLRVPGKLDTHYQPSKPLYYSSNQNEIETFCASTTQKIFVIAHNRPQNIVEENFYCFTANAEQLAYELYFQLRSADASDVELILIELPPAIDSWLGVRERILKAGQPLI